MYTYSRKSRRRMHAISAAIALLILALIWGVREAKAADFQCIVQKKAAAGIIKHISNSQCVHKG